MKPVWCVRHREGWCAVANNQWPDDDLNTPTKCDHVIVLHYGIEKRLPTCPDCLRLIECLTDPPVVPHSGACKQRDFEQALLSKFYVQRLRDDRWTHHRACKTLDQARESLAWLEQSGKEARILAGEELFSDRRPPPVVPPEPEPDFDPLAADLDACEGDIELTGPKEK